MDDDGWFLIFIVLWSLRVVVELGLAKVAPSHQINTIFGSIVATALHSEYLVRILSHGCELLQNRLKRRRLCYEVDR